MDEPKYKVGERVIHNGKRRIIYGCNNSSHVFPPLGYLIRDAGKSFGSIYDDQMEVAWRANEFNIDYTKLKKGNRYYWAPESELTPYIPKNSLGDIINKIRKEING